MEREISPIYLMTDKMIEEVWAASADVMNRFARGDFDNVHWNSVMRREAA